MTMLFFLGTPALLFVVGLAFARFALTHDPSLSAGYAPRSGKEVPKVSALARGSGSACLLRGSSRTPNWTRAQKTN